MNGSSVCAGLASAGLLVAGSATAVPLYETSFSSSDTPAFADGGINFSGNGGDQTNGQGGYQVTDAAGVGFLTEPGTGFQRAILGNGGGIDIPLETLTDLATGNQINIDFGGFSVTALNPGDGNLGNFGLANLNEGNPLGGSQMAIGLQLVIASGNFAIGGVDSGVAATETIDLTVVIANGAIDGEYDVTGLINGVEVTTLTGLAPNLSNGGANVPGFRQNVGAGITTQFDSFAIEVIPEPASLGLLAAGAAVLLSGRRRS
ncbi:MAG: PEP-CTERM sorting domain-containing protein [Planctomycetota bacterium]